MPIWTNISRCLLETAVVVLLVWPASAETISFPADAGVVNVKALGAKGDGITDDTLAIRAALKPIPEPYGPLGPARIVYFPNGTYVVSGTLLRRFDDASFANGMVLVGESREGTVIRLRDGSPGYADTAVPKAVVFTASKLVGGDPTGGGKDYAGKGEGNDAYYNFVENLTIDTGAGNPGAIAIDYLANNLGAIRNVRVRGSGAVGISMRRKWVGPALLQDVEVEGFRQGIAIAETEYSVTMERVRLSGQSEVALVNDNNVISARGLSITAAPGVPAIRNRTGDGLVVVDGGTLTGSGARAVENAGTLLVRGVTFQGFSPMDGIYEGERLVAPARTAWSLPVSDPPVPVRDASGRWTSVVTHGARPDGTGDSTSAIRAAMNSGASTVYFPKGVYVVSGSIEVPASVRRVEGLLSTLRVSATREPSFRRDQGVLRTHNDAGPLMIQSLAVDNTGQGSQVGIEAAGTGALVLRDIQTAGVGVLRPAAGGPLYLENICCGPLQVEGPQGVWARQLNSEGSVIRITNKGAPLWILGLKTERPATVVDNGPGAVTEILGGLIYPVLTTDPTVPALRNLDGKLVATVAFEAFDSAAMYRRVLSSSRGGAVTEIVAETLRPRGKAGRMGTRLTTGP